MNTLNGALSTHPDRPMAPGSVWGPRPTTCLQRLGAREPRQHLESHTTHQEQTRRGRDSGGSGRSPPGLGRTQAGSLACSQAQEEDVDLGPRGGTGGDWQELAPGPS